MSRPLALALFGALVGCGGAPTRPAAPAADGEAEAPGDPCATVAAPGDRFVVELASPEGAAALAALLNRQTPDPPGLGGVLRAFYADHGDDYDLLMLVAPDARAVKAAGRFIRIGPADLPQIGVVSAGDAALHPIAPRLAGVVVLTLPPGSGHRSGPALHESLHRYGQFLPRAAGFPGNGHWGDAGVNGQLGGFDPATLRCVDPPDARPPGCAKGPDGRFQVAVGRYAGFANGGDRVPYAPLELYLMGLLPADEVPTPIPVLKKAKRLPEQGDDETFVLEVGAVREVAMARVLEATGGPRPPASEAERNPRAAFVLVTAAPADDAVRAAVANWARGLAGALPGWPTHSYCSATGGRARLDTRIGPAER